MPTTMKTMNATTISTAPEYTVPTAGITAAPSHDAVHHPPCSKNLCLFLSEYAAMLLGSGATCVRLERNVRRIAAHYGHEAVMTIMPRHIHMTVCNESHRDSFTYITAIRSATISFDVNTRLSELSWDVADGKLSFRQARKSLQEIYAIAPADRWAVLLLASLANGAFCRLFGGDITAVLLVVIATAAGFFAKQQLVASRVDMRIVFIICAFVSSVIASSGNLFGFGSTPDVAVGTSVLYLVPGIPFLNSFSDMLAGHYICSFSRFMGAVLLTASLSIGLLAGMMLMNIGMF